MDFTLKVVGGDISAIPGVADALEVWKDQRFCIFFFTKGKQCTNYISYIPFCLKSFLVYSEYNT